MLGERKIRRITNKVLSFSSADQTEVLFLGEDSGLTRFANSYIHQNVAECNAELRVRVVVGKKVGVASTNDLSDEALQRVVETALTIASFQQENPDFNSLPEPVPLPEVNGFVGKTAAFTPEARAKAVGVICQLARDRNLTASGAFTTVAHELVVANSLGIFAYYPTTLADLNTVIMSDSSSGYANAVSLDVAKIDSEAVATEAVEKAIKSRKPLEIEPGEYTVILEEHAVANLLLHLSHLGLGALAVQERRSFMCDRFGEKITSERISIWDDGLDPKGLPMPFDFEGVPKQRINLIKRGIAKAVVYDSSTAGREKGKKSTGHALPAPNTYGPVPINLFMGEGETTKEEMLASTEKGIWVTRFWYTNPVHPLKTIITGMTRDGTFLIKDGEIAHPIKNLRFTQSILEALARVEGVGEMTKLEQAFLGAIRVPALKIEGFNFTGTTQF